MTYCDQAAILRPNGRWDPVVVPGKEIYTAIAAGERIIIWTDQGAWELTPGA